MAAVGRMASKEQYVLWFLPYLQLGMRVVAVQYRLSGVAPAPAGVEDCRCALRWVFHNAAKYGIDPKRVVLTGGSAGGHLVLLTGLLRPSDGFDGGCPGLPEPPQVAGIINYYGPTDLVAAYDRKDSNLMNWLRRGQQCEGNGATHVAIDLCAARPAARADNPRRRR